MSIAKKVIAGTIGATGALAAAAVITGHRWKANPDPLRGEVPRFPKGDEVMVPVDDGAELRVLRAGKGPTVVLVHGLTSNADDWGPVAGRLISSGHRVIGVNQRGHGGSTIGADGFGAPRLGRDLRQVLAALDISDAVLVGHSMGGMASLNFAVDHPNEFSKRVRGLGLVSTLASTDDPLTQAGLRIVAGRPNTALGGDAKWADELRRRFGRAVFGRYPNWTAIGHVVATALRCPDDSRIGAANGLLTYNVTDRLPTIGVPTTVMCGTFDVVTYHHHNAALAEAIPQAQMVTLPNVGHVSIWEAADRIADEIASLTPAGLRIG